MNLLSVNQPYKKDVDKQMDNKDRPEGLTAVGDIAEENTCNQATDSFQFRLTEME
jgi:hypothetical protein